MLRSGNAIVAARFKRSGVSGLTLFRSGNIRVARERLIVGLDLYVAANLAVVEAAPFEGRERAAATRRAWDLVQLANSAPMSFLPTAYFRVEMLL